MKSLSRILSTAVLGLIVSAHLFAQDGNGGGDNNNGGGGGRRNRGGQGGGPGGPGGPGGGNWDPAQMRQRMMERMREQFAVKDDAEWKLISERIEKVNDARRESMMRGMGMMFGGGRGGRGPGGQGGGEAMPEQEALQKAIEANASSDEIKSKLNKYREALKAKEAVLTKAQDELREVLSAKQEAQAVLMGLLK